MVWPRRIAAPGAGAEPRGATPARGCVFTSVGGRRAPACGAGLLLRQFQRPAAIADAAQRLVELRDRWLNPPEWVEWLHEPVPGYPTRPGPRDEAAATALKTRTLTSLYNARPQWLADAHAELNAAVAGAYGWSPDISDDDALAELLALNGSR